MQTALDLEKKTITTLTNHCCKEHIFMLIVANMKHFC